jgi:Zn-dependent M16 (insulinase) family peptidase
MYSYRDPNVERTFGAFRSAAMAFARGETAIDSDRLVEAILSACKAVDPLESPDTKGRTTWGDLLRGFTPELRRAYKGQLLATTAEDLRRVASRYLATEGRRVAVGSADLLRAARAASPGLFKSVESA